MTICHKMSRVNMRWGDVESPHRRSSWLQILPLFGICSYCSSVCLCKANPPHKVCTLSEVLRLAGCFSELKSVLKLSVISAISALIRFKTFVNALKSGILIGCQGMGLVYTNLAVIFICCLYCHVIYDLLPSV